MNTDIEKQKKTQIFNIKINNLYDVKILTSMKTERCLPDMLPRYLITHDSFFQGFEDTILKKTLSTVQSTSMRYTYADCRNLLKVTYLDQIITNNVEDMYGIFANDRKLNDYSGIEIWKTDKCTDFSHSFENSGIESLKYFKTWKFKNCKCISMFKGSELKSLEGIKDIDFSNITCAYGMFSNLKITSLKGTEELDLSHIYSVQGMFANNKYIRDFSIAKTWKLHPSTTLRLLFGKN